MHPYLTSVIMLVFMHVYSWTHAGCTYSIHVSNIYVAQVVYCIVEDLKSFAQIPNEVLKTNPLTVNTGYVES